MPSLTLLCGCNLERRCLDKDLRQTWHLIQVNYQTKECV